MKNKKTPTFLRVYGQADGQDTFLGTLSYSSRFQTSAFQWSDEAIGSGTEWSPLNLPIQEQLWTSSEQERDLQGLPGIIHDALPDGWGVLLMDRAFGQAGMRREDISPLMRLALLGDRCWGALKFEPQWGADVNKRQKELMVALSKEAKAIDEGDTQRVSEALLIAGGSPQGARPKVFVAINDLGDQALVGYEELPPGYRHVLVKFAAKDEHPMTPALEYCYVRAAIESNIPTSQTQLLDLGGKPSICFDRFDREEGCRRHVHSLAGMLHITHRVANADWTNIAEILQRLPGGKEGFSDALNRAVFNAVLCVRDDHSKNHAFMRHPDGSWSMTPAFDIAYSDGPGGYHTMMYAQHTGKNVRWDDLLRLGEAFETNAEDILEMVDRSKAARDTMLVEAKGLEFPKTILTNLKRRFGEIDKDMKPKRSRTQRPKQLTIK